LLSSWRGLLLLLPRLFVPWRGCLVGLLEDQNFGCQQTVLRLRLGRLVRGVLGVGLFLDRGIFLLGSRIFLLCSRVFLVGGRVLLVVGGAVGVLLLDRGQRHLEVLADLEVGEFSLVARLLGVGAFQLLDLLLGVLLRLAHVVIGKRQEVGAD